LGGGCRVAALRVERGDGGGGVGVEDVGADVAGVEVEGGERLLELQDVRAGAADPQGAVDGQLTGQHDDRPAGDLEYDVTGVDDVAHLRDLPGDDGRRAEVGGLDAHRHRVVVQRVAAQREVGGELALLDRDGDEPGLGRGGLGGPLGG